MNYILNPWPWYVSGPLIAIVMAFLLYFGKTFGMSSNLRTMCTIMGADKFSNFFKFNWKDESWNLTVVAGAIIGGFIATHYLSNDSVTDLNPTTITELQHMGFENAGADLVPQEMYNMEAITSTKGVLLLIIGGLLVGFGTRYAGGCTSGHAITGLSSLQKPSLIAVIGFFIGGLIMTNFILPLIF
ncbi:YeeE/YedE thiosulfate transporter family protein [Mariniflexile litorale]|uniref:YeeE/YedE thiosulfate transporter family protein n=1 Tax=Mariniflexile litorale TaxID=3045158 RepID=A0AAU7EAE7_9FLAO|nr:YeeE/YedE thiosulfate transporter family protein [Mariniflexile sp. KMM 9835]MDQ8213007.1 YeeE/YedE thiosulfate transporter family protein [Mariniflexile sp. KMM 9835]